MSQKITLQREQSNAGYFRIGNLILDIPPEQIQCHKVINGDEVMPLRFPFSLPIKTGQSRWDVTWSWKAMQDASTQDPYKSWRDVQLLLAMFKASPFVEVENEHIRQLLNPSELSNGATADDTMAFALRQMRVDTVPDLTDTLQISMTMSLFNYRPYSAHFQYDRGDGKPVSSALNSSLYDTYLRTWVINNIEHDPTQQPEKGEAVSSIDWESQTPGTIVLSCREYTAAGLPHDLPIPGGAAPTTPGNPGASKNGSAKQGVQSGFTDNVFIDTKDIKNPQIQWWIQAAAKAEGAGFLVKNSFPDPTTGKTSSAYGILQWVKAAAIDALKQADDAFGTRYVATAQQAGFLVTSRTSPSRFTWSNSLAVATPQSSDPTTATYWSWMSNPPVPGGATTMQNNMATAWAWNLLKRYQGSVLQSWEADRFGPGKVASGKSDPALDNRWFTASVNSWRGNSNNPQDFAPTQNTQTIAPTQKGSSTAVTTGTDANSRLNLSNSSTNPDTVPMTYLIRYLLNNGWTYDYATEAAAFLYKEHWIKMTDQDSYHGDTPNSSDISDIDPGHFVYPNQISVVFVNNIAQIPLAGYQYPTYQHLGPVSTLVSIGMLSNADIEPATDLYDEPKHTGLALLSDMTNMLENQFQRLRNEWRRVNSIHRMQSFSVKNQILNMLGIRGLLTKEFTTETVPDAANMVSAQYNAIQYENVYKEETPNPFRVTAVPQQVNTEWLRVLRDGSLNQFKADQSLLTLTNLSSLMQKPNNHSVESGKFLFDFLANAKPQPRNEAYLIPTPALFQGTEQQLMIKLLDEEGGIISTGRAIGDIISSRGALLGFGIPTSNLSTFTSFRHKYPDLTAKIKTHSQLNYSDFHLVLYGVDPNAPDYKTFLQTGRVMNERIAMALAANPSLEDPIDQLFDEYVDYAVSNNVLGLRDQMVRALNTPQLKNRFVTADNTTLPGSVSVNNDHGCYRDLGIRDVKVGGRDFNPALYFYDDNKALTDVLQSQISAAVASTVQSSQIFSQATPYSDKSKLISATTESFTGNVHGILSKIKPSSYTMAKAFPTFKLFLMEDNSSRPFFAYDNFYSYATVVDMEIIRYRDKPDTAVIQVSNLMHLLDQHLYDDTVQGRQEQRLRANTEVAINSSETLTSNGGVGAVKINEAPGGAIFTLDNRFNEINKQGNGDQKFPLKYFALQTGTKVQVRMGFSNNPDLLVPVFTGEVTEIAGSDMLTITAQSYMTELISPTPDDIRHDGFAIDSFVNHTTNALVKSVRDLFTNIPNLPRSILSTFSNSPAYGGWGTVGGIQIPGIITPGGGAADVISAMLKVSTARHFGHWQLGSPTDPYLKGYTWQAAAASALSLVSSSPLTRGATGLEAGYNRSFENILTSHIFGPDGNAVADADGGVRGWWYEKPGGYGAPEYYVPKDPTLTPWTLIQDIARRYPEFILTVKQYGFPYTADATLVFANPHDFYTTRPPMPKEIEVKQQSQTDTPTFNEWWFLGTNSGKAQFIAFCQSQGGQWANLVLKQYDNSIHFTGDSAVTLLGQVGTALGALNIGSNFGAASMRELTANQLAAHIDGGGPGAFFDIIQRFIAVTASVTSTLLYGVGGANAIGHGTSPNQAQQAISQLVQNYYNFVNHKTDGSSTNNVSLSDRMKPVRRYHLVNGDNIVHNGIMLNEKFYNTVSLLNQTIPANDAIPSQYRRVLVADPYLVSPNNLKGDTPITNSYIQSFLRDELAKAYRGELVLMGNPEIEPFDVLVLLDSSTGISGPVEVDSVIHSFNMENGYITIVKPRAMTVVNDKLSAPIQQAVWKMLTDAQGVIEGYSSKLPFAVNVPTVEVALGIATLAGGIAAGPWIAGAAALGGSSLVFWTGKVRNRLNPMGFIPLTRFERPWISGLEGWKIDDVLGTLGTKWQYFKVDEIEPLIESYRTARGMQLI